VTGPHGTITLKASRPYDDVLLRGWGDFAGDGSTDVLVDLYGDGPDTPYIVPGSIAPGTYNPAAVGVRVQYHVSGTTFEWFPVVVGDQNGDGADDVSFGPALYSGRALMHGGPLPAPFKTLPSPYVGLLQLDPHQPPSFVVPDPADSFVGGVPDPAEGNLDVLDHRADRLLFNAGPIGLSDALANHALANGWLIDGHHVVEYSYVTRSGTTAWRWDLDSQCGT